MMFDSTADSVQREELAKAENGLGGTDRGWGSGAAAGMPNGNPGSGNGDNGGPSLHWLRHMVALNPARGGVGDYLDPPNLRGPSWPGDRRYQDTLVSSMTLTRLDDALGEGAAALKDHWAFAIVLAAVRIWFGMKASRSAAKGNWGGVAALQLFDMAATFGPSGAHVHAWLDAVNQSATTDDPEQAAVALDQARLNFAKAVVSAVSFGLAALPRSATAAAPNALKDITPSTQVPALQTATPGPVASQLPTLARTASNVRQWMQEWVHVLTGLSPMFQFASFAAGAGDLGVNGVFLHEDHRGAASGNAVANGANGTSRYPYPEPVADFDRTHTEAYEWMYNEILHLPVIRNGRNQTNSLRDRFLRLLDAIPFDGRRQAAMVFRDLSVLRQSKGIEYIEDLYDEEFYKNISGKLETKFPGIKTQASPTRGSSETPATPAKISPSSGLKKLTIDGQAMWAPLSDAEHRLMREFIRRYRENPDKHFPLYSEDVRNFYGGLHEHAGRRIDALNQKLQKGWLNADGSGTPVVIGKIEIYKDSYNSRPRRGEPFPKHTKFKPRHGVGSRGSFFRFHRESPPSVATVRPLPTASSQSSPDVDAHDTE